MQKCDICSKAINFHEGLKGKNADITKLLFVGHKPDSRIDIPVLIGNSYEIALDESKTGDTLNALLDFCNLTWEDIYWTNMFKCTLPDDEKPTKQEYANCLGIFKKQVDEFSPKKIILFGQHPYNLLFPDRKENLTHTIGQTLDYNNTPTLIMFHPSKIWSLVNPELKKNHYQKLTDFLKSYP